MADTYGPSNWAERPQESRSRDRKAPTPENTGEMEAVIWQARDIMNEQVSFALDRKDLSPDAMLGLAWKLADLTKSQEASSVKKIVLDHESLIRHTCEAYTKISPAYIEKSPHAGDRVKKTAKEPRKLAQFAIDYVDKLKDASISTTDDEIMDQYALGCLSDILNITAIFLDQQKRNGLN